MQQRHHLFEVEGGGAGRDHHFFGGGLVGSRFDHFLTDQYNRCVKKITRNFLVIVETWLKHSPHSPHLKITIWDFGIGV